MHNFWIILGSIKLKPTLPFSFSKTFMQPSGLVNEEWNGMAMASKLLMSCKDSTATNVTQPAVRKTRCSPCAAPR